MSKFLFDGIFSEEFFFDGNSYPQILILRNYQINFLSLNLLFDETFVPNFNLIESFRKNYFNGITFKYSSKTIIFPKKK